MRHPTARQLNSVKAARTRGTPAIKPMQPKTQTAETSGVKFGPSQPTPSEMEIHFSIQMEACLQIILTAPVAPQTL